MKTLLLVLGGVLLIVITMIAGLFLWARISDGPKGPIAGGVLESGQFVNATNADWEQILGDEPVVEIELQLESSRTSRTTGAFTHDGHLYVPCDLGYVWRRLPGGVARAALHTMWLLKDWHLKALEDGRVIARIEGNRYKLQAVEVTNTRLLEIFRAHVSNAAAGVFELRDVQTDPEDIWFFRLDPRES
jgi:hypothetical protein